MIYIHVMYTTLPQYDNLRSEWVLKNGGGGEGGWLLMGYFYLLTTRHIIYPGNTSVSPLDVVTAWMLKYRPTVTSPNTISRAPSTKNTHSLRAHGPPPGALSEGLRSEHFDDIIKGEYAVMTSFFRWLGCVTSIDSHHLSPGNVDYQRNNLWPASPKIT